MIIGLLMWNKKKFDIESSYRDVLKNYHHRRTSFSNFCDDLFFQSPHTTLCKCTVEVVN